MVEHHDEFYDFDRLEMNPAPSEYIPLWIGGISETDFSLADDWLSDLQASAKITKRIKRFADDIIGKMR